MSDTTMFALAVAVNVGGPVLLCFVIARKQKRSGWWALAGLLHIWGIFLVACLPAPHAATGPEGADHPKRSWYERLGNSIARYGVLGGLLAMLAGLATLVGILLFAFGAAMLLTGAGTVRVNGEIVESASARAVVLLQFLAAGAVFGVGGVLYLRFVRPAVLRATGRGRLEELRQRPRRR